MQISRDSEGLRFMGEWEPESGFVAGDIRCVGCGRRIDPHVDSRDVSLACTGCGNKKAFWAEAEMQVFLAENWSRLREACTHPTIAIHQSS
jgi:ribosomal protein S27E